MIKFSAILLLTVGFVSTILPTNILAQSTEKFGEIQFDEPFNDPDEITAKELAKVEGISIAESRNRLKLMNEASVLIQRLRSAYPNQFSGALAVRNTPFRINIYFAGLDPANMQKQLASFGASPRLQAVMRVGNAPKSEAAARATARSMLRQLQLRGIAGTVAWSSIADSYKLLVKNPAEASTAARMGHLPSGKNIRIEQFDGIQTVLDIFGGQLFDGDPINQSAGNCTIGFMVRRTGTTDYGASTAAHCPDVGNYVFYQQPNTTNLFQLPFAQGWLGNGADIQWHRVNGGPNSTIVPKFWNGTSKITATGGQGDYPGLFACKFGITTYRTCGYVYSYEYTSVDQQTGQVYGDFPRINKNLSYLRMVEPGDSGGPVFVGSLAMGLIHGRDTNDNMYYMPLRAMSANGIPISVTCQC